MFRLASRVRASPSQGVQAGEQPAGGRAAAASIAPHAPHAATSAIPSAICACVWSPYLRAPECEAGLSSGEISEIEALVAKRLQKKLDKRFEEADELLRSAYASLSVRDLEERCAALRR